MHKYLSILPLLISGVVYGQQISEIKTDGLAFNEGSSVKFEISFNGQGRCGLQFNFGDGSTSDFRVEDSSKPIVAIKTYPAKGAYKIEANGKTLIRGLNSFTPCKGNAKIEIAIGQNSDGQQKAESPIGTAKATAQTNSNQIVADSARASAVEAERQKAAEIYAQAEAQAKKDSIERAKVAAEENLKKEQALAQAAAKAKQDIDRASAEINSKGNEFAKETGNIWKLFEKKDPLSGKTILFARAESTIASSSKGVAEIYCSELKNDKLYFLEYKIVFSGTTLPSRSVKTLMGGYIRAADGRVAQNAKVAAEDFRISQQFSNVVEGIILVDKSTGLFKNVQNEFDDELLHRLIFEIVTSNGNFILKIPPLANSLKQLAQSCK
jgi:hypothetical protein